MPPQPKSFAKKCGAVKVFVVERRQLVSVQPGATMVAYRFDPEPHLNLMNFFPNRARCSQQLSLPLMPCSSTS
jgi:hypothetical protein